MKKCYADEPLVVPLDGLHIDDKLQFVEEPVEIMDREVKRLKRSRIPLVKVRWNSKRGPEFTWEREDQFRKKYPHLFSKTAPSSVSSHLNPPSPDYVPGPEELEQAPPSPIYVPFVPEPVYPKFLPVDDEIFPAEEQQCTAAELNSTHQSPGYIPESDPEEDPEEEDPEEESSDDDDDAEEEHLAPADPAAVAYSADQDPLLALSAITTMLEISLRFERLAVCRTTPGPGDTRGRGHEVRQLTSRELAMVFIVIHGMTFARPSDGRRRQSICAAWDIVEWMLAIRSFLISIIGYFVKAIYYYEYISASMALENGPSGRPTRLNPGTTPPPVTDPTTTTSVTSAQLQAMMTCGVTAWAQKEMVDLTQWFERMEWTVTNEVAYAMTWMFPEETDKIERYVGGMPDLIYSSVVASKPKTMQEAIEMATELMDRRNNTFAERQAENRGMFEDTPRNNKTATTKQKKAEHRQRVMLPGTGDKKSL
ncbi:hypothetical protein Tco_1036404 [Tanacetum coccineum]